MSSGLTMPLEGTQRMRRRSAQILLLLGPALLAILAWHLLHPSHTAALPFTYDPVQGSVRFRVGVAERTQMFELNTFLTKTAIGRRLYHDLVQEETGLDQLNPSTNFALASYRIHLFYEEIEEAELHPHTAGLMGFDLFAPYPGFEGQNSRRGARITLDFKTHLLKIEDGPTLEPLKLPEGTLQAPMLRDEAGRYYVLLPLNYGASCRFVLGIGVRDVSLPTGAVLFPAPAGTGYVDAVGVVPITLTLSGQEVTVLATALPGPQMTGVLGMTLLANYRVIVDFRNPRLYLEPANSSADQ